MNSKNRILVIEDDVQIQKLMMTSLKSNGYVAQCVSSGEAGIAYLNGNELSLTPMEYKLLCLLAKNVGKVLTYTFITKQIWGNALESDMSSLRVFMASLRKKIEIDTAHPIYIQTHIGTGYRMLKL